MGTRVSGFHPGNSHHKENKLRSANRKIKADFAQDRIKGMKVSLLVDLLCFYVFLLHSIMSNFSCHPFIKRMHCKWLGTGMCFLFYSVVEKKGI